jgi:glycine reductase
MPYRVVHYINQFFGQVGGEDKADTKPFVKEGVIGPGMAFKGALGKDATIVATVVCGDGYFNENMDTAEQELLSMIKSYSPDILIAGPAFNAGRYGVACGAICAAVGGKLGIPVVTGMYPENPGADMYKKNCYIVKTSNSAAGMRKAVPLMAKLALKLLNGEPVTSPDEDQYIARGIRKNVFKEELGAKRAVDMLIAKLGNKEFTTEYPMPAFDRVTPNPPIKDMSKAKIALVTSGGIVPKGNPDKIESSSASKYGRYSLAGVDDLTADSHETAHGGYDPVYANEDPNRVLPVDVMRDLEKEGVIGELYDHYYATVGNGTSVANAKKYAQSIAKDLIADGVQAVILTST